MVRKKSKISKKKVKSLMIIYGKQVCIYALRKHEEKIGRIYLLKKEILPSELFRKYGAKIKFIENRWAQSLSSGGNHQGIIVEMEDFRESSVEEIKKGDFLLLLDGVTDAGNIGAIVRSAYAMGVDAIVIGGVGKMNFSAITRTSSGALLDMQVLVRRNLLDLLNELRQVGFSLYGASMEGVPIEKKSFGRRRALLLGSEDRGLSAKVRAKLDETVSIEMKRDFDSLNVSAAAAIIIHRMSYAVE
jgi:23S rRNA (guanosine2251-2'-O)-methyltransferase